MHSQKNSEMGRDLTETRCALATATCLQHPERLAQVIERAIALGWIGGTRAAPT